MQSNQDFSPLAQFAHNIADEKVPEAQLLADFEKIAQQDKDAWKNHYFPMRENKFCEVKVNLLHWAIMKKRSQLALKLIEQDAPITAETISHDERTGTTSPTTLHLACKSADKVVLEKLLDKTPDFSPLADYDGILLCAPTPEICEMILSRSKDKKIIKNRIDFNVLFQNFKTSLDILLPILRATPSLDMDTQWQATMRRNLDIVREHWQSGNLRDSAVCDAVCDEFNRLLKPYAKPALEFDRDIRPITLKESYQELYGTEINSHISTDQEAIKDAIAQIHVLLHDLRECFELLKILNQRFKEDYAKEHKQDFPAPDPQSYEFDVLDGLYYPRPHAKYKGIEKNSALQKFLLSFFEEHDVKSSAYKLIGFLPSHISDRYLKNGVFTLEDTLGHGLFHGKLSHMLQQAIILLAIKTGKIKLHRPLTAAKILDSFSTEKDKKGAPLWLSVRDNDHKDKLSFSGAFAVNSVIMHKGAQLGCPELASSLIDTFCKGLFKQLKLQQAKPAFKNLTMDTFFAKLADRQLVGNFFPDENAVEAARLKELEKGSTLLYHDAKCAVFQINRYTLNQKNRNSSPHASVRAEAVDTLPRNCVIP